MNILNEIDTIKKGKIRLNEGNIQVYNLNLSSIVEKALIEKGYDIDVIVSRISDIDRGSASIQVYRKIER